MKITIKELKRLIKNKKEKLDEAYKVGLETGRSEMLTEINITNAALAALRIENENLKAKYKELARS